MTLKLNGSTAGSVSIDAPADTSPTGTDVTLTLPTSAGSSGQYLQTNGSGTLSWQTVSVTPDAITEGNTSVEVVDTGSDGHITFDTEGSERARITSSGGLLLGTTSTRTVGYWDTIRNQIEGAGYANAALLIYNHSNDNYPAVLGLGKTRGTTVGSNTVVSNGDELGEITFYGSDGSTEQRAASIGAYVDTTPGSNDMPGRLVFSTTADGSTSPTERLKLDNAGNVIAVGIYNQVSGGAANVGVNSGGTLYRSTSSIKYKTDVETLQDSYADALLECRPVWYHSLCENDNPEHSFWGFIAEEVAEIDPRLVHWKTVEITYDENGSAVETPCDPEPEGVAYDRFVPHLINLLKRQKEQLESQAATIAALDARLTALEGGAS